MTDFLKLAGKHVLVMGVANRKSVAFHSGKVLREAGAKVIWTCRSQERHDQLRKKLIPDEPLLICDVERQPEIDAMAAKVGELCGGKLAGLVHSIAFANYSQGLVGFEQTVRADFLQAIDISCFSFIAAANALAPHFDPEGAAAVTISISTTEMAAQNYGYMAPVKAALDSAVVFLAKSFGERQVRFNAVGPGLLKTSASAGIPNYIPNYLFAEKATLRKKAVQTSEAADVVAFLLSPRSSGINAQHLVIDAGMRANYFDAAIVEAVTKL
jgi:enoyl-[acyl-carrier protein] reductase I